MVKVKERTEDKIVLEFDKEEWDILCNMTGVVSSRDPRPIRERILEKMR